MPHHHEWMIAYSKQNALTSEQRYELIAEVVEHSRIDSEAFITPDEVINSMQRLMDQLNRNPDDLTVSTFSEAQSDTPVKYEVYLGMRLARLLVAIYYPFINIRSGSTYRYAKHLSMRARDHFSQHQRIPTNPELIRFLEHELIKLKISKSNYWWTKMMDWFKD